MFEKRWTQSAWFGAAGILAAALLFLPVSAFAGEAPTNGEAKTNKDLVREVIEEVLNKGRLDHADALVAEKGSFGPDWFRTTYRTRRAALPDLTYRIEEMVAEGDRVVVRFTAVGTPNGPVALAPSDEKIEVPGVAFFKIDKGKIVGGWELTDMLRLLRKTGYSISPPTAP